MSEEKALGLRLNQAPYSSCLLSLNALIQRNDQPVLRVKTGLVLQKVASCQGENPLNPPVSYQAWSKVLIRKNREWFA